MTNHTATVEALTAKVQILMVGSRQVTLSVYNQLDYITDEEIVPFGRVAPKDAARGHVYVVGKDRNSGALVRAWMPTTKAGIELWVRNHSKSDAFATKASKALSDRDKHLKQAQDADSEVAELLEECDHDHGRYEYGSYKGAACQDAKAVANDDEATGHEAEAAAAQTETARLGALAKAAASRHKAAESRAKASAARQQAADLQASAEEHQQAADRLQDQSDKFEAEARAWETWGNSERDRITRVADEWEALPLIVLAGLR